MNRPVLAILIALYLSAFAPHAARAARPPLVLAFYYAWFDENSWTPGHVADMPVTTYTSRDPQTIARQIQQARSAGIDAFVVSWWGKGNPTEDNVKTMLDQAHAANFSAAVDFELTSPFYKSRTDVVNSLKHLIATHAQHPAYLRADDKPVIFFWREQKYSVDAWKEIRDEVDPQRQTLWIAEGDKRQLPYLKVFDGYHLYSVDWMSKPASEIPLWNARVRAYGADRIWVATAMPGASKAKRGNGDFYRQTWQGAITSTPDWIIISTWNEWVENTQIEPSVSYGDLFLNITREYAGAWKTSPPAPPPSFDSARDGRGVGGEVLGTTTDILRVRGAPSTDSPILGRLREGASVALLARSEDSQWWQIALDAKRRGWISAVYVQVTGDASALPIAPTDGAN